jgi:hypothetical protein
VKEELHDRIQRVLDAGEGLTLDETLEKALEEAGEEARAEAEALAKVDTVLRAFAEVELSDDAAEAIATRIEQRLDEDLARIPDPVAPPIFGDNEGPQKKAAPPKPPPKKKSKDYSLANLTSLSVKDAPAVKPDAPLRRPPQKPVVIRESQVKMVEADELGLEELPDSAPPPAQADTGAAVPAAAAPAARNEPSVVGDEPASIPSVQPFDLKGAEESGELPPPPVDLEEVRARRRTIFYWGSGLAAAAAVLVVAVTGLSTMGSPAADEEAVAMVAPEPAPAATAEMEMEESEAMYRSADPMAPGEAMAADEADRSVAATETASVVEAPSAEEEPTEEAEPEASATGGPARAPSTEMRRARRSAGAMAERPAPAMARASGGSMATPTRDQVLRAMRAVQPRVSSCGSTRHGTVQVNVTVSGSTGRVRNAVIQGEFAGTREGSCVARAVRRARFPEFGRESFSFTYPFRI